MEAVLRVGYIGERASKKCETAAKFMGGNELLLCHSVFAREYCYLPSGGTKLEEFSQEFSDLYTCQLKKY